MSNEIETFSPGGDLQPYSPSPPMAPSPDFGVDTLTPHEIADYQGQSSGQTQLFGEILPPGTSPQAVQQALGEIAGVFMGDMARLNHPQNIISAAISWFQTNALQPVRQEQKRHRYNLYDQANDPVANGFANAMTKINATQDFISHCLWWLNELNKRLGASQGKPTAQGRAPITSASQEASLTDAEWAEAARNNSTAQVQTEVALRRKWGDAYMSNLQVAQSYLNSLPANEQRHFDVLTTGGVHMLNTEVALSGLFDMAIGVNNIPRSGGAVATEIQQIEALMRTNRKAYNNDLQIQGRLRTLYSIRDGGR